MFGRDRMALHANICHILQVICDEFSALLVRWPTQRVYGVPTRASNAAKLHFFEINSYVVPKSSGRKIETEPKNSSTVFSEVSSTGRRIRLLSQPGCTAFRVLISWTCLPWKNVTVIREGLLDRYFWRARKFRFSTILIMCTITGEVSPVNVKHHTEELPIWGALGVCINKFNMIRPVKIVGDFSSCFLVATQQNPIEYGRPAWFDRPTRKCLLGTFANRRECCGSRPTKTKTKRH